MKGLQAAQSAGESGRPTRAEIDPAALDLVSRFGPQILRIARRYSLNADDAEDAYQRGLEILLTKAPSTRHDELVPWLKTVVKHEAFAIRRQRERSGPGVAGDEAERAAHEPGIDEQAERLERLRLGAEAMGRLKPQEVRCLLLRAEGYSYRQICDLTGFSYTKVNRCVTEGRRSFLQRLDGIESGEECRRLAPLLSAFADGEAPAADVALLRPHLRGCLACRAQLREYRAAPARVAALVPPAALAAGEQAPGGLSRWVESIAGTLTERTASVAVKAHGAVEIVSAQKIVAVAASTAVLAGGSVATVRTLEPPPDRPRAERKESGRAGARASQRTEPVLNPGRPVAHPPPQPVPAEPPPVRSTAPAPGGAQPGGDQLVDAEALEREAQRTRETTPSQAEFEAEGGDPAAAAPAPTAAAAPPPAPSGGSSEFGGGGGSAGGGGGTGGGGTASAEFGP